MKRHLALATLALAACAPGLSASRPDAAVTTPGPEEAADICAVRSPCAQVIPPTDEEVGACVAVFEDRAAPCRSENAALFVCSLRAARCTAEGEIDEEASLEALEAQCGEAQTRFEACCAEADESVHCELLRQEGEEGDAPPAEGEDPAPSSQEAPAPPVQSGLQAPVPRAPTSPEGRSAEGDSGLDRMVSGRATGQTIN